MIYFTVDDKATDRVLQMMEKIRGRRKGKTPLVCQVLYFFKI